MKASTARDKFHHIKENGCLQLVTDMMASNFHCYNIRYRTDAENILFNVEDIQGVPKKCPLRKFDKYLNSSLLEVLEGTKYDLFW